MFDLGNVVLGYNPLEYLEVKVRDINKIKKLYDIIFRGEEWVKLDEGTITEKEAIRSISCKNPELKEDIELVFNNWYEMLKPIESTIELIGELKHNGYKVYFLSNFHDKAFQHINEEYTFFRMFDGGVVSYREKLIKPNVEIYKILLHGYNLNAEECIFIDDVWENINVGESLGIKGIHTKNIHKLREEIVKYIKL